MLDVRLSPTSGGAIQLPARVLRWMNKPTKRRPRLLRAHFVFAPVDSQVHIDASPLGRRDAKLSELWRAAHVKDVVPGSLQLVRQMIDGSLEGGRVSIVREKIHVMSKTINHPVFAHR